jgi:predicted dehydrogenase
MSAIRFNHEYAPDEKIRVGYLGCGDHSFRNLLPCFQYAPVDLVAVCDRQETRAQAFASTFGARQVFTDYERMLQECDLDAVFIVTGYGPHGVTYPPLAIQALHAGCDVFIEKPPANSVAEVQQMQAAEAQTGRFVFVGFKKVFFPAVAKARELAQSGQLGWVNSIYARYPQRLPLTQEERQDRGKMRSFLDHVVHPASILYSIGGEMASVRFNIDPGGGSVSVIRFADGKLGNLHLVGGGSGTSPLERLEVVGDRSNVVVDNGVKLTWYRPGGRGPGGYGRSANFIGPDEAGPIVWEPEFSLGQLYNKGIFLLGYAQEILYFCECVRKRMRPELCNTDWARALLRLYEAYQGPEDVTVNLDT